MQKKFEVGINGGNSGSKKCRRGYIGAYGEVWHSVESGSQLCVDAFCRNLASAAVKMFSLLM
jgi:hypothetical protein